MRVLFVGTNRGGGGTESHFVSMARALAAAGHEVHAAVRPDDFIHKALEDDAGVHLIAAEFRNRRDLRAIRQIARLLRELRPDLLIGAFKAEYWGLALAARSAGVPLVLFSHLDQRIRPIMVSRLTRLARGVLVPSHFLRKRKLERGIPEQRVAVLHNPVDVEHFRADPALRARVREQLGLPEDAIVVGYVGRFEAPKGVEVLGDSLTRAMHGDPRIHALWVGHGRFSEWLHSTARDNSLASRHHWMPWLDDVRPAYAAMDMLALPSTGSETFGRVLVEAQACGVPVLGARNGGIPEALADGETGVLLPPGDVEAWSAGILDLARDAARRKRMGEAGRAFAMRFDARRIAAEFPRVIARLGRKPTPARATVTQVRLAGKALAD